MVSHFEIVDEIFIQDDKSDNETMKKSKEYWRNVFKEWVNERNFQADLEVYESDVLDQTLSHFHTFRNSVILVSMLLTSNRNGSS